MADNSRVDTGGGAKVGGGVDTSGGNFTGRDNQPTQTVRTENTFQGVAAADSMQLWFRIMELAGLVQANTTRIQAIDSRMDNLPERVAELERTEVTVRVATRTQVNGGSVPIRERILLGILAFTVAVIVIMFLALVYIQVRSV